jgi:hypothetical protein
LSYVESSYNLVVDEDLNERFKPNLELMKSICETPKNWTIEHDEELAELLKDIVNTDMPGSIRNLVRSISVSTQRVRLVVFESCHQIEFLFSFTPLRLWRTRIF